MGITGSELKVYPQMNLIAVGVIGGLLGRLFHSWYRGLQVKQSKIKNETTSKSKLAEIVEEEVIKRINTHRNMRRILGYFLMALYYVGSLYLCIQFSITFDNNTNTIWAFAFLFAVIFEYFVVEIIIIYVRIEAINYLKIGGSQIIEGLCRNIISEEFLKTFD